MIGAWIEARSRRPDGVVDSTCVVAAFTMAGAPASRADLACRAQSSPGRVRLVPTASGGTLAAWQAIPDFSPAAPLRSSVVVFARAPGAADWSPGSLAIADVRGYHDLEGFGALAGGGALLVSDLAQSLRSRDDGRVRAVEIGADGAVRRRLAGPPTPGRPPYHDQKLFVLGGGRRSAILLWPLASYPYRYRASLLALEPAAP